MRPLGQTKEHICFSLHHWSSLPRPGVVGLIPSYFHTMLVRQDGSVWSTSVYADARGEHFVNVISSGVKAAAAGNYYSMVLKQDDSVWATGVGSKGRLSVFDGSPISRRKFSVLQVIPKAKAISAGGYHGMVLTQQGRVWAMGWNKYGQLGHGSESDSVRTSLIEVIPGHAKAVTAGDLHSVVMMYDGSVWATGKNYNGQLGDGSKIDRKFFMKVMPRGAITVAAGGYHTMVLKQDGSVWATGWNEYGQLGDSSSTDRSNYVQVVSSGANTVAAGCRHSMVLKQDGSVWATGYNEYGQLGDGSTTDRTMFVKVVSDGVTVVAAGAFHSMVAKEDGTIWATGSNKEGQFGDGSRVSKKNFTRLSPFSKGSDYDVIMPQFFTCMIFDDENKNILRTTVNFVGATTTHEIDIFEGEAKNDGVN